MKKNTYKLICRLPFLGKIIRRFYDPMLFSSFSMQEGLPKEVIAFNKRHPDIFITKKVYKNLLTKKVRKY